MANSKISKAESKKKARYMVNVLGVKVVSTPFAEVIREITDACNNNAVTKPYFVVTVNPEIVMWAQKDKDYKEIINNADLPIADGSGLRMAGVKNIVPGRIVTEKLLRNYKSNHLKVFYLGGRNGVSRLMAEKYGGHWDEGSSDIRSELSKKDGETKRNQKILDKINKFKPDLLLVAYGAPWQEKWIAMNLDKLKVKVIIGVGGTFDYLTGRVKLPPDWITRAGLEWLWRLVHEPWRWRRQLVLLEYIMRVRGRN